MTTQQDNVPQLAADIVKALNDFQQSDAYRDLIQAHIKKMIHDSLDEVFGWRGEYHKQFQQLLKDAMPNDIKGMVDLAKYNTLFFQSLQTTWADNALPEQVVKQAQEVVLEFTKGFDIPQFITMSKLIETFIEDQSEEAAQEGWERPHILFAWNERCYSDSPSFGIGIEDHKAESRFSYSSSNEKDKPFLFKYNLYLSPTGEEYEGHKVYKLYSGRLGDTPLGNSDIKQHYSYFEQLVACMYYGGTKLVLDTEDMDDFYYPSHD